MLGVVGKDGKREAHKDALFFSTKEKVSSNKNFYHVGFYKLPLVTSHHFEPKESRFKFKNPKIM